MIGVIAAKDSCTSRTALSSSVPSDRFASSLRRSYKSMFILQHVVCLGACNSDAAQASKASTKV